MSKPVAVRFEERAQYSLFDVACVTEAESAPVQLRDVTCNNFELVPGAAFAPQTHDDKLEVVTAVPQGDTEGPVVRYSDEEGGYAIELAAYDSIIIPRGVQHMATNLCDCKVVLIITNFDYVD